MHWYGKGEVVDQRKVGHVTITASTTAEARSRLAAIDPAAADALAKTSLSIEEESKPLVRGSLQKQRCLEVSTYMWSTEVARGPGHRAYV